MGDDAVADGQAADAVAQRRHFTRAVGDGDQRKGRAGKIARCNGHIQEVQRGGAQAQQHLAPAGLRLGQLGRAKRGEGRSGQLYGFHGLFSGDVCQGGRTLAGKTSVSFKIINR